MSSKRNRRKKTEVCVKIVYYPCHAWPVPEIGTLGYTIDACRGGTPVGRSFSPAGLQLGTRTLYPIKAKIVDIVHTCYRDEEHHSTYQSGYPSWEEGDFCLVAVEEFK
jgi:hypothetical protein